MMKLLKKFMTVLAVSIKTNLFVALDNVSEYLCNALYTHPLKNCSFAGFIVVHSSFAKKSCAYIAENDSHAYHV